MKSGEIKKTASRKTSDEDASQSSPSKASRKVPQEKSRALGKARSISAKETAMESGRLAQRQGQTKDEMNHYRRLEAVGALAGDIAHDFNNALTAIMHNVYAAKMFLGKEGKRDEVPTLLDDCMKTIRRATSLAHQLLAFSGDEKTFRKLTHLKNVIMDSVYSSLIGSNIECKFHISGDLWPAYVDEEKIGRVISNLVINERQAILGGGIVEVSAANVVIGKDDIPFLNDGRYVKLSIKNVGTGMSEKNMNNTFDPCFSAKMQGNCLYLAASYSLVKKQGGLITVESEEGAGTTFHVYLPVAERDAEKESLTPA